MITVHYKGHDFSVDTAEELEYLVSILPVIYGETEKPKLYKQCGLGDKSTKKKTVKMTIGENEDIRF